MVLDRCLADVLPHSFIHSSYFAINQKYNKVKCGKGKEAYTEAGGL